MQAQLISGGTVVDVIVVKSDAVVTPNGKSVVWGEKTDLERFDAPKGCMFRMEQAAGIGWILSHGKLVPPAMALVTLTPKDLKAHAAAARYAKEVEGIVVGGVAIATDDRSKQMILGLRVKANADPNFTTQFKGVNGVWVDVNAATIITLSDAVFAHIDHVFGVEQLLEEQIDSGDVNSTAQIDAAFA